MQSTLLATIQELEKPRPRPFDRLGELPRGVSEDLLGGVESHDQDALVALAYLGLRSLFLFTETIYNYGRSPLEVPYHLDLCDFLADSSRKRKLVTSFRGGYKTSVGISSVAWDLARDPNTTVLITSYKFDRASERIGELKSSLERNELLRACYPYLVPQEGEAWSTERLTVRRTLRIKEASVQGVGIESGSAGVHVNKILTDDIVNEQNFQSPDQLRSVRLFIANSESLLQNAAVDQIVHIGNRWGFDDVYGDLLADPAWSSFAHGGIWRDRDRGLTWMPQKYPPEEVKRIERAQTNARGRSFYLAQYEGEIISDDTASFDVKKLTDRDTTDEPHSRYCVIDPAISSEKRADDTVILEIHVTADGEWTVAAGIARQGMRPEDIIEAVYRMQSLEDEPYLGVAIETQAYQKALLFAFEAAADTRGYLPLIPVTSQHKSKEIRIKAISPKWNSGGIHVSPYLDEIVAYKIRTQFHQFPSGKHDDLCDSIAYCAQIRFQTPERAARAEEAAVDDRGHILELRTGTPGDGRGSLFTGV